MTRLMTTFYRYRFLVLLLVATVASSDLFPFFTKDNSQLKAEVGAHFTDQSSAQDDATVLGIDLGVDAISKLYSNLKLHVNGVVKIETGSTKSLYDKNEFNPKSHVSLEEAVIEWSPFSFLLFQGGAVNQKVHNSPLLLSKIPFLSTIEGIQAKSTSWYISFAAQQSLASNKNLSARLGSVEEGRPLFFSEKVRLGFNSKHLVFDIGVQHYAFDKLSRGVAYESLWLGNSIIGQGSSSSIFRYGFKGWESSSHFDFLNLGKFDLLFHLSYLRNQSAPSGKNQGFLVGSKVGYQMSDGIWAWGGEFFRNESDTAPGFYSSKKYGHQNRQGFAVSTEWENNKKDMALEVKFVDANLIKKTTPYQTDETLLLLELRKDYDIL